VSSVGTVTTVRSSGGTLRVFRAFREEGFHRCMLPKAFGGIAEKLPPKGWHLMRYSAKGGRHSHPI